MDILVSLRNLISPYWYCDHHAMLIYLKLNKKVKISVEKNFRWTVAKAHPYAKLSQPVNRTVTMQPITNSYVTNYEHSRT